MMLHNPRSVERDNQNELRKFPFSDVASCTNGTSTITPGAIIDAQLYVPGREPGRVWMSSVGTDGKIRFSDASGEFAETSLPAAPNSAVPVTFTGDGGPLPGGVVVFGRQAEVAALMSLGGQSFSADQTELAPSAVAYPGLPGVLGFRLDDGNVVYGAVRFRGDNGCEVSTYVDASGTSRLRISAVGADIESVEATGFITRVIAESDNSNFVISRNRSIQVIDIQATGVRSTQDGGLSAGQSEICSNVKKARGTTLPAVVGISPDCGDRMCDPSIRKLHKIMFKDNDGSVIGNVPMSVFEGDKLGTLDASHMPKAGSHPGMRFVGYFDRPESETERDGMRLYYRYDGTGIGKYTETEDVTLHAHWMEASSRAEVTFVGYGTLHLAAPDALNYENPISISGIPEPIPTVSQVSEDALKKGGEDALADIVLSPTVPCGTVVIGIRGLDKAYSS